MAMHRILLLAAVLILLAAVADGDDLLAPLIAAVNGEKSPHGPSPEQEREEALIADKVAKVEQALAGGGEGDDASANGPKEGGDKLVEWHASLPASLLNTTADTLLLEALKAVSPRLAFSFAHVVSGFAARLTDAEVGELSKLPWCVEALPDARYRLATTYTPELLGVSTPSTGAWSVGGSMGEGVIVGVLDNGIDPRHVSFSDDGMPPNTLAFGSMLQRMEFSVKLRRGADAAVNGTAEGSLRWVSGKYSVRSPIAVLYETLPN